ncbi:hypothetical protein HMI56_006008 [Coelomomyces lativittatus]|nr:hypothetical protein HMI56_006008 [Coelomomyces lativittatus]
MSPQASTSSSSSSPSPSTSALIMAAQPTTLQRVKPYLCFRYASSSTGTPPHPEVAITQG